jgi:hypothetical protein
MDVEKNLWNLFDYLDYVLINLQVNHDSQMKFEHHLESVIKTTRINFRNLFFYFNWNIRFDFFNKFIHRWTNKRWSTKETLYKYQKHYIYVWNVWKEQARVRLFSRPPPPKYRLSQNVCKMIFVSERCAPSQRSWYFYVLFYLLYAKHHQSKSIG